MLVLTNQEKFNETIMLETLPIDVYKHLLSFLLVDDLKKMTIVSKRLGKEGMLRLEAVQPGYSFRTFCTPKETSWSTREITTIKALSDNTFLYTVHYPDEGNAFWLADTKCHLVSYQSLKDGQRQPIKHVYQILNGQIVIPHNSCMWTMAVQTFPPKLSEPKVFCTFDQHYFVSKDHIWCRSTRSPNLIDVYNINSNAIQTIDLNTGPNTITGFEHFFPCSNKLVFVYTDKLATFDLTTKEVRETLICDAHNCSIEPYLNSLVFINQNCKTVKLYDIEFNMIKILFKDDDLKRLDTSIQFPVLQMTIKQNCLLVMTCDSVYVFEFVSDSHDDDIKLTIKAVIPNHAKCCSEMDSTEYMCDVVKDKIVVFKKIASLAYTGICVQIASKRDRNLCPFSSFDEVDTRATQSDFLSSYAHSDTPVSDTVLTINDIIRDEKIKKKKNNKRSSILLIIVGLIAVCLVITAIVTAVID